MKTFNELTEKEIRDLTQEEINDLIKFEKIQNGIKLIEKPKKPELIKISNPDMTSYRIYSLYNFNLLSLDSAQKLASLLKEISSDMCSIEYNSNSEYRYARDFKFNNSIEEIPFYSKELYDKIKSDIKYNEMIESDYNQMICEFEENEDKANEVLNPIYKKIEEIKTKYEKLDLHICRIKSDYLTIDSDINTALKFYKKAYVLTEEDEDYILNNLTLI